MGRTHGTGRYSYIHYLFIFILQQRLYAMNHPSIIVIGSSNTDMVIKSAHLPMPGETILGGVFFMNAGGRALTRRLRQQDSEEMSALSPKLGKTFLESRPFSSSKKKESMLAPY